MNEPDAATIPQTLPNVWLTIKGNGIVTQEANVFIHVVSNGSKWKTDIRIVGATHFIDKAEHDSDADAKFYVARRVAELLTV